MSRWKDDLAELAVVLISLAVALALIGLAFLLTFGAWAIGLTQIIQWGLN